MAKKKSVYISNELYERAERALKENNQNLFEYWKRTEKKGYYSKVVEYVFDILMSCYEKNKDKFKDKF